MIYLTLTDRIDEFLADHKSEIIHDLKHLIQIPSVKEAAAPGAPNGAPCAMALNASAKLFQHTESAGLCNRCSPYLAEIKGVCIIDNLSGINTPKKIGPMLKSADFVVITKGDIVSQAEREVFAARVTAVNPNAVVMHVNGLNGQGAFELSTLLYDKNQNIQTLEGMKLRFPMPAALCSYCLGETRIGKQYQLGNVRKMNWEEEK